MPKINDILLKLEGFQYDTSRDLNIDIITTNLAKTQVTYARLFFHGGNIVTSVYQW